MRLHRRSTAAGLLASEGPEAGRKARCAVKMRDGSRMEVDMLWINEGFVVDWGQGTSRR